MRSPALSTNRASSGNQESYSRPVAVLFAHFGSGSTTAFFCAASKRRTPVTPSRDTL
jgi:hypothetical protein